MIVEKNTYFLKISLDVRNVKKKRVSLGFIIKSIRYAQNLISHCKHQHENNTQTEMITNE